MFISYIHSLQQHCRKTSSFKHPNKQFANHCEDCIRLFKWSLNSKQLLRKLQKNFKDILISTTHCRRFGQNLWEATRLTSKLQRTGTRPWISVAAAVSSIFTRHSIAACILATITKVAERTWTVVAVTQLQTCCIVQARLRITGHYVDVHIRHSCIINSPHSFFSSQE